MAPHAVCYTPQTALTMSSRTHIENPQKMSHFDPRHHPDLHLHPLHLRPLQHRHLRLLPLPSLCRQTTFSINMYACATAGCAVVFVCFALSMLVTHFTTDNTMDP